MREWVPRYFGLSTSQQKSMLSSLISQIHLFEIDCESTLYCNTLFEVMGYGLWVMDSYGLWTVVLSCYDAVLLCMLCDVSGPSIPPNSSQKLLTHNLFTKILYISA